MKNKKQSVPTGTHTSKAPATPAQAAKTSAKGDKAKAKIPAAGKKGKCC